MLDDSVAKGMDTTIQLLVNQCEFSLLKQNPKTYDPMPEKFIFDCNPTSVCLQIIKYLETHQKMLKSVLDQGTFEVFFEEVAQRFYNVILKNIRRLQISQLGATQLAW